MHLHNGLAGLQSSHGTTDNGPCMSQLTLQKGNNTNITRNKLFDYTVMGVTSFTKAKRNSSIKWLYISIYIHMYYPSNRP